MEATFDRGLDDHFVDALNREYRNGGWWRAMVDDRDLFVAVRDNRVNVYHHGCSLVEVRLESGEVVGRTHYKYLLRPSLDSDPYVSFENAAYVWRDDPAELFVASPAQLKALKGAAKPYAEEEKTGVHQIIKCNANVLDVEIGFGLQGTAESDPSAPRVDFATLWIGDERGRVVFYEAKRFANHDALRSGQGSHAAGGLADRDVRKPAGVERRESGGELRAGVRQPRSPARDEGAAPRATRDAAERRGAAVGDRRTAATCRVRLRQRPEVRESLGAAPGPAEGHAGPGKGPAPGEQQGIPERHLAEGDVGLGGTAARCGCPHRLLYRPAVSVRGRGRIRRHGR